MTFKRMRRIGKTLRLMDAFFVRVVIGILRDFHDCHDDFELKPKDGILDSYTFKWLGFVNYIHVSTSLPHQSMAPRVVLIHKQFVIGTAVDLLRLPKNYKLGSVIFGDYERDEDECGLTLRELKMGLVCPRAYFVMPFTEIIPHPEFTRFRIGNSLALIKLLSPLKSAYMTPICLPTVINRQIRRKRKTVFMVDYLSTVPLDIDAVKMGKKTLKLYSHKECKSHHIQRRFENEDITHLLCTSGCGVRTGAPIASHDTDGLFQLIGLSVGSEPCGRRSMRRRFNEQPPIFIDVYPYNKWIINVISASLLPRPYPKNFALAEGGSSIGIRTEPLAKKKEQKYGWRGRTFVSGNYCYKSAKSQARTAFFYSETFEVKANPNTRLTAYIKVSAGVETTITCARLLVPNHRNTPVVDGIGGPNVTMQLNSNWFPHSFKFTIGLNGKNSTSSDIDLWWSQRGDGLW